MKNRSWLFLMLVLNIAITNSCNKDLISPNHLYGTVTDIEGNIYKTIVIGKQTWMAENLKTRQFNDGTTIPYVTDGGGWRGYCWYHNDSTKYSADYGALYKWYTVTNTHKLCPTGWHVPTDAEWSVLTDFLGYKEAGGKLKEAGLTHWFDPNQDATNESGFTALPGGCLGRFDAFFNFGTNGHWWTSTQPYSEYAWSRTMSKDTGSVIRDKHSDQYGFSVRCLRDD